MLFFTFLQTKVNMILILHVRFLLQWQYSKKQDGLCQLDLTSDILANTKKVLYKIFIEGETKGKKMSPEQVEKILKQKLQVSEYVTSKQIRSLFSRQSSMYRQGKLKEPTDNQIQKNVDNLQDGNDSDNEEDNAIDLETEEGISQSVLLQ